MKMKNLYFILMGIILFYACTEGDNMVIDEEMAENVDCNIISEIEFQNCSNQKILFEEFEDFGLIYRKENNGKIHKPGYRNGKLRTVTIFTSTGGSIPIDHIHYFHDDEERLSTVTYGYGTYYSGTPTDRISFIYGETDLFDSIYYFENYITPENELIVTLQKKESIKWVGENIQEKKIFGSEDQLYQQINYTYSDTLNPLHQLVPILGNPELFFSKNVLSSVKKFVPSETEFNVSTSYNGMCLEELNFSNCEISISYK